MRNLRVDFLRPVSSAPKLSAFEAQDAFVDAAAKGNLGQVKALLQPDGGATIDGRDRYAYTALMAAAQEGHLHVVKYLIKNGANEGLTNNCNYTAEQLARAVVNSHNLSDRANRLAAVLEYFQSSDRPRKIKIPSPAPTL